MTGVEEVKQLIRDVILVRVHCLKISVTKHQGRGSKRTSLTLAELKVIKRNDYLHFPPRPILINPPPSGKPLE